MRVIEAFVKYVPREDIPDDAKWFIQDGESGLLKFSTDRKKPERSAIRDMWVRNGYLDSSEDCFGSISIPLATDAELKVLPREELMRAYDLTDQGYALWFGGDCPVVSGAIVDVVLRNKEIEKESDIGENYRWSSKGADTDIIAYRIGNSIAEDNDIVKCDSDSFGESHRYNRGAIECIDIIKEMTADKSGIEAFCVGNVVKYLYRYKDKNGMADVIKARNYLNKIIEGDKSETI